MYQYSKTISREIETDVLVVGAGSAGFGAAVAAARNGAKTLIIEKGSEMGGMATAGLVGPFMTCFDDDAKEQVVKGIFDELCLRMEEKGGAIHPSKVEGMTTYSSYYIKSHCHVTPFVSEVLAITMEEMLLESGAEILYQTNVIDVIAENRRIEKVVVAMKEGLATIKAKYVIDCTGDADIASEAGFEMTIGSEKDGVMQPTSLFFEVGNIDREAFVGELESKISRLGIPGANCWSWYIEEAKENGDWHLERNEIGNYEQPIKNRWKINATRIPYIDATKSKDITKALIEGRKQVQEVLSFMRKYVPGCENIELIQVASCLGVRETRRIAGEYSLTAEDILAQKHFEDAICTFAYAIDIHNSEGGGATFKQVNHYYNIPYRCLLPQKTKNLIVAGRSISGTSEAAASYRVIPCCIATGEAAGTAAAMALNENLTPAKIDAGKLQKQLIKQGAVIKDL